jgi:SAM-dependent methyltransferase
MPLLDHYPGHLKEPLSACAEGRVPANIALMRFLIEARDRTEADEVLSRIEADVARERTTEAAERLRRLVALWHENPQAFAMVKTVLADVEHGGTAPSPQEGVSRWAALFGRMAEAAPEGGVALYALGNPDLLRAATDEVVQLLSRWNLLGPDKTVLDIGCGIGRFITALAPDVGHITGLDIAEAMIARARERCANRPNVTLLVSSGQDLAPIADGAIDLVLAADVFPYLVQTGRSLVERHLAEGARVLKAGGAFVILNYSYRGDPERDRDDLEVLADREGLTLSRFETGLFALWDAVAFRLDRS